MSKIPAGLVAYPDVLLTPSYSFIPSSVSWTNYSKNVNPSFLAGVDITLAGSTGK
jgi:hypothetical protein